MPSMKSTASAGGDQQPIASTERAAGCCAGKGAWQRGLWQAHYEEIRVPVAVTSSALRSAAHRSTALMLARDESAVVIKRGRLFAGRVPRRKHEQTAQAKSGYERR